MIYFDNAATTAVRKEVLETMLPYFSESYGNASSVYGIAQESKKAIENARAQVATVLGATPQEIYFTSGGTEADNWAIRGTVEALANKGNHIITSAIEHHAVLETCQYLEKKGFEVTYLPVDEFGLVNIEDLKKAIKPTTILITIMFANNEIGTVQPVKEIGAIAKEHKIVFHTDAVQAIGQIDINVNEMNIDLLSISAHKIYGPKGVGALYIRKGTQIKPLLYGGSQERNRRAGTENVPGIVGFGQAVVLAAAEIAETRVKFLELQQRLISGLMENIEHIRLNGHPTERLPGNVNISFEFIEGESILLLLDMKGFAASSGSACTSGSLDPSHVLLAIGLPHEKAHGSLRISFGKTSTMQEVDQLIAALPPIVKRLRDMSPLYEDFIKGKTKESL